MAFEDIPRGGEAAPGRARDRLIGVYIGILAVVLAVCSMGGDNAAKESTLRTIEASNVWAFFQAKNLRRQVIRTHIDDLEIVLATTPGLAEPQRAMLEGKIREQKAIEAKLTSDPQSKEGLDELFVRGKAIELVRDAAMAQDPYFDYGQALLQIAIVLASVAIISGGSALLIMSLLLGGAGGLLTLNGFTMLLAVPFIG